jgi:hypothetical protein
VTLGMMHFGWLAMLLGWIAKTISAQGTIGW